MDMKKLLAFDLDGTITQHRTKIEDINYKLLYKLQKMYRIVVVGAGMCERIFDQLNHLPVDIIGNYGMQQSHMVPKNGTQLFMLKKNIVVNVDKEKVINKVSKLRKLTGYLIYSGDSVEFHESGAITFPLLGTNAPITEKVKFDPDRSKRKKIYSLVKEEFKGYTVFIGGSSSFDIVPKGYDKYIALRDYASQLNICERDIIYFGDDFGEGGNDEHIYKSGIKCILVDDYKQLAYYINEALQLP